MLPKSLLPYSLFKPVTLCSVWAVMCTLWSCFLLLLSPEVHQRLPTSLQLVSPQALSWVLLVHLFRGLPSLLDPLASFHSCLLGTPLGSLWNSDKKSPQKPTRLPSARRRILCPASPQLRPATQRSGEACAWGLWTGSSFSLCNGQGPQCLHWTSSS